MNSVKNHIRSSKHHEGVKRLKSKELLEKNIEKALKAHNQETHLKGETLPDSQQVYCGYLFPMCRSSTSQAWPFS